MIHGEIKAFSAPGLFRSRFLGAALEPNCRWYSVEFAVIVVMCGFTKIVSTCDLSPSWHIPQQTSRGYAVDAIIQILIEIYSIRLKLKPQIILTI